MPYICSVKALLPNETLFLIGLAVGLLLGFLLYWISSRKGRETDKGGMAHNAERAQWFSLQLQAYERVVLFLERITLENLLSREKPQVQDAGGYYLKLVEVIRGEYEHNLTQQLYLPEKSWERVENIKNQIVHVLSEAQQKSGDGTVHEFKQLVITAGIEAPIPVKALIKQLKIELKKTVLPYLQA